jgi:hypothetical protein
MSFWCPEVVQGWQKSPQFAGCFCYDENAINVKYIIPQKQVCKWIEYDPNHQKKACSVPSQTGSGFSSSQRR